MADMASTKEEDLGPNLGPRVDSDNTDSRFKEWTTIIPEEEIVEVPGRLKAPRFNPRAGLIELGRYVGTGAAAAVSSSALEGVALSGGAMAAGINPLVGLEGNIAIAIMAFSYVPLIGSIWLNAEAAWKSLKETGTSVSFLAKIGYDLSRKVTSNERAQRVATFVGFSVFEVIKEIPWWMGFYTLREKMPDFSPEHYTPNMEYAFIAGANVFATGYQAAQAGAVEVVLRGIRNRGRIMKRGGQKIAYDVTPNSEDEHLQKGS